MIGARSGTQASCCLKQLLRYGLYCLVGAIIAAPASGGQFTVTPVRLFMTPKDRAIAVTITNEGDDPLVMQADLYLWKQKAGGEDDLTLTEDLFLSPPIIKLAPKAQQVVRLAMVRPRQATQQLTYRMIVREVPEARAATQDLQLQIAVAFNIPIFITPPGAKPNLSCSAERAAPDTINAICENTGNAFVYPVALLLTNSGGDKIASRDSGAYILPGIKRSFDIKSNGAPIPPGKVKLVLTLVDGSEQTYEVNLGN